ncbi:MAG: M6 family metalloprotease domain-containing protein [Armatimonadetes bacterium]|nr:M6 family metalloprotease domain-containing protein [Armatimonadota bacterium]
MTRSVIALLLAGSAWAIAAPVAARDEPDLSQFRTTATAIRAASELTAQVRALPGYLGVMADGGGRSGVKVLEIEPGSPAEKAGMLAGDQITAVAAVGIRTEADFAEAVLALRPGVTAAVTIRRKGRTLKMQATPIATSRPMTPPTNRRVRSAGDVRPPPPTMRPDVAPARNVFAKPVYALAAIPVEFADVRMNPAIPGEAWSEALFSKGTYAGKSNPTGQAVHGSMNDYYQEVSCGALSVQGKVFAPVALTQPRASYGQGTGARAKTPFLTEALDALTKREGQAALDEFDGIMFIYAGSRPATTRGGLFWPHRSSVTYAGKRRPYFIVPEGGQRMSNISVMVHEFGHMLGLPDLYARPENPGSEGAGMWCAMSQQAGDGRPQHMSAWCKERMGWLKPVVLDPAVPQKLLLSPIAGSATECYKVMVRPDGSEYFLLENRKKTGFDAVLPAEGLLIWRVVGSRPFLEESHGIEGPAGPTTLVPSVPYPSAANAALTPHTLPSSRSLLGGGKDVHISNIRRLEDGRVTFYIGHRFR